MLQERRTPDMTAAIIEASGLTKTFGRTRALDGLNLSITGAGVLALLGPNGAGKTSFVNAALGLIRPSHGELRLFGAKPGSRPVRQRIGVMMQDADLPDRLTARELIGLFASYYPSPLAVERVIERCALSTFADARYGRLSGGQKRRVQFALALIGGPDLIFLDEPTTGLDTEARRGLWEIVREAADEGARVILTTHYLEEADALADRVAVIHQGRLIADDDAAALRTKVGGSLIRCATNLTVEQLDRLPQVREARRSGRFAELIAADAVAPLKALFELDDKVTDLTVRTPSLEEAFDALIAPQEETPS
jgi:ABC-2 type transport system ATP-binding protein